MPLLPRSAPFTDSAHAAAKAGAAAVHCHARDADIGAISRDLALAHELVERIRDSETDGAPDLTAFMGGDFVFGGVGALLPLSLIDCLPKICTLDCGMARREVLLKSRWLNPVWAACGQASSENGCGLDVGVNF